jgi:predicted tellurium resistance membrane protein TerC
MQMDHLVSLITDPAAWLASATLTSFVHANPTILMPELAILLFIGTTLVADGFGAPAAKGYIYVAMAFSAFVEGLYLMARRTRQRRESHR